MIEPLETRRLFHSFTLSHGLLKLITHPDPETVGLRILGQNAGNDTLIAVGGNDTLVGGPGDDKVTA